MITTVGITAVGIALISIAPLPYVPYIAVASVLAVWTALFLMVRADWTDAEWQR